MPKTTKLGIEITTDNETKFLDWREFINGDSPDSMANIVDNFAINITNLINAIYESAVGGLDVETWSTATKTLALSDANKSFVCNYTDNQTLTIPANEAVAFPIGTMISFLLTSTYTVTFSGASGVTLTSIDSLVELATQYGMVGLIKLDTNTWQLVGAL